MRLMAAQNRCAVSAPLVATCRFNNASRYFSGLQTGVSALEKTLGVGSLLASYLVMLSVGRTAGQRASGSL